MHELEKIVEKLGDASRLLDEVYSIGVWSKADDTSDNRRRRAGIFDARIEVSDAWLRLEKLRDRLAGPELEQLIADTGELWRFLEALPDTVKDWMDEVPGLDGSIRQGAGTHRRSPAARERARRVMERRPEAGAPILSALPAQRSSVADTAKPLRRRRLLRAAFRTPRTSLRPGPSSPHRCDASRAIACPKSSPSPSPPTRAAVDAPPARNLAPQRAPTFPNRFHVSPEHIHVFHEHIHASREHVNLAWRTVNAFRERVNLVPRPVNAFRERVNLVPRTVNVIRECVNLVPRTVNATSDHIHPILSAAGR